MTTLITIKNQEGGPYKARVSYRDNYDSQDGEEPQLHELVILDAGESHEEYIWDSKSLVIEELPTEEDKQ